MWAMTAIPGEPGFGGTGEKTGQTWQTPQMHCEGLGEPSKILREARGIDLEWTMFSASIAEAAALSCGCKVSGARHGGKP